MEMWRERFGIWQVVDDWGRPSRAASGCGAVSGDICSCDSRGGVAAGTPRVEAGEAARHPPGPRASPRDKEFSGPNGQ